MALVRLKLNRLENVDRDRTHPVLASIKKFWRKEKQILPTIAQGP